MAHARFTRVLLAASALILTAAGPADAGLFQFEGKSYSVKDLSAAEQQAYYDIQSEQYGRLNALAQQAVLNLYIDAEAKKSGKTHNEAEAALFAISDPTEKQISEWYEANKARIPPGYTLEKISGEIKGMLREQQAKEKREALLAKLKADKKFVLLASEPEPLVVDINSKDFPIKGPANAKVTIIEFADYQCPHCKVAATMLDDLLKKHPDQVKLIFIDFPIKGEFSQLAAQGAFCAGEQGKFWPFHDLAYEKQHELGSPGATLTLAKELKLDEGKFTTCLNSDAAKARVNKGKAEGERLGTNSTPSIYINGRRIKNHEPAEMEKAISKML